MELLSEYIKALTIFMVFSAMVRIIAPSSSYKKYIDVVLGLMLIGFILEPFASLLSNTKGILATAYDKYQYTEETMAYYEKGKEENAVLIAAEYKKSLNGQITGIVEKGAPVTVEQCRTVINEDYSSNKFGEIWGIHLTVLIPYKKEEKSLVREIAFGSQDAEPSYEDIYEKTVQNIKNSLMDFYNVDKDNIHITVR